MSMCLSLLFSNFFKMSDEIFTVSVLPDSHGR